MGKSRGIGPKILELKLGGSSYRQIMRALQCSMSTVTYHCTPGEKERSKIKGKNSSWRKNIHPFLEKLYSFKYRKGLITTSPSTNKDSCYRILYKKIRSFNTNRKTKMVSNTEYSINDVIAKIGESPKCYLTGDNIDISKSSSYNFDHIIPVSRGGNNSLENLGICTKEANFAKQTMTPDEFIFLCKKVLQNNGYKVDKC